jgi:hypothetical protein
MIVDEIIHRMVNYFGTDVRRINHALKVYSFASFIGRREELTSLELDIIDLTAILHDIGIRVSEQKYHSSAGNYQEKEGPPIARQILEESGISAKSIDRICYIIGNHHSYTKIDGIDFQILVEADFLVNIFEDEMKLSVIQRIKEKYFRTETGKMLIDQMYISDNHLQK